MAISRSQRFKSLRFTLVLFALYLPAEEGMWTFDNPPVSNLSENYQFTPTDAWLEHVRLSCVRFNNGGSGSFISEDGLVLTNHHVAVGILQKISTKEKDYVTNGFYAKNYKDEIKSPDLELNILVSIKDITRRIEEAVPDTLSDLQAMKTRQEVISDIEKQALDETGLRSDVVVLYQGGEYWLYQYKQYKDVRLVMAPERQAAYFGGDDDNFTYPRYDLDMAFFRVYENDKPLHCEHFLRWNKKGAAEDELVFVSGHPGRTSRLYTVDQLQYQRDSYMPMILDYFQKRIDILNVYSMKGDEEKRRALTAIFSLQNSQKAYTGMLSGLKAQGVMEERIARENEFRNKVNKDSTRAVLYGDAWDIIAENIQISGQNAEKWFYRSVIGSKMADWAVNAVFYHQETVKPDADRLKGYLESELEEFKFYYGSRAPVYKDYEIVNFTGGLQMSLEHLGKDDPFIESALSGGSPDDVAADLITASRMDQSLFRKNILDMTTAVFDTLSDPLIVWAKKVAPVIRIDLEYKRDFIESRGKRAEEKIGKARFAVYGKTVYPDANFTLRLSYGTVKGYPMNGTKAPVFTTLYGLYDRSLSFAQQGDYALPERFWQRQSRLNLATPVNTVCNCDIIGGNSGSPVINRNAELVGLVFDGNIESLPGRFYFDGSVNRTVSVHAAYIIEALRKLYDADKLANEIEGK